MFGPRQGRIKKNIHGVARGWQEILRGGTLWQRYIQYADFGVGRAGRYFLAAFTCSRTFETRSRKMSCES